MAMAVNVKDDERKFILDVIRMYRDLPVLWKVNSPDYSNRIKKAAAYNILIEKFSERYPEANREIVVKKINSLRTNYRKEQKRIGLTRIIENEKAEARLWYYDEMIFLNGQQDRASETPPSVTKPDVEVPIVPAGDVPVTAELLLKFLQDDLEVGAVVLDLDMNMNYLRLQKAVVYAKRADVLLIMGASDSEVPVGKDLSVMGPSHFNKALECMVGRESMRFGKPGKYLNAYVADLFKLDPRRTLLIGDGFTDMAFANEGGYQKLMVLSGITKLEDIEKCSKPDLLPDYYLNSLVDLAKLIEDLD